MKRQGQGTQRLPSHSWLCGGTDRGQHGAGRRSAHGMRLFKCRSGSTLYQTQISLSPWNRQMGFHTWDRHTGTSHSWHALHFWFLSGRWETNFLTHCACLQESIAKADRQHFSQETGILQANLVPPAHAAACSACPRRQALSLAPLARLPRAGEWLASLPVRR